MIIDIFRDFLSQLKNIYFDDAFIYFQEMDKYDYICLHILG